MRPTDCTGRLHFEAEWGSLAHGDQCRLKGEGSKVFVFHKHGRNIETGAEWLTLQLVEQPLAERPKLGYFCHVRPERFKNRLRKQRELLHH